MPYFIYRSFAFRSAAWSRPDATTRLEAASARTKELRASPDLPDGCTVRMVFAQNELEAEDLLNQVRAAAPGVVGDE